MISHKYKFIFIHIEKTGGTSINDFFNFDDVYEKHGTINYFKNEYGKKLFDEYFKFTIVRNPWDWLVSRYHWSKYHQKFISISFNESSRISRFLMKTILYFLSGPHLLKICLIA